MLSKYEEHCLFMFYLESCSPTRFIRKRTTLDSLSDGNGALVTVVEKAYVACLSDLL